MKKIDRLILRSFIGPLVLTFTLSVLVLLMQFVWKYVDDLVGKGLDFSVIAELLLYASATFVPMALPIARLLRYYIIFHMKIFFNDLHALLIAEFSGV